VERGYHLASTDISCTAFGVPAPPRREYGDVAFQAEKARWTPEEAAAHEAEQARLYAQLLENRRRFKLEMERRRDEWRRTHAPELLGKE
jgi:hypothetical protein